eukprot:scaffold2769_cov253-Pinguiococcus_pyrenoidosus.AAC.3
MESKVSETESSNALWRNAAQIEEHGREDRYSLQSQIRIFREERERERSSIVDLPRCSAAATDASAACLTGMGQASFSRDDIHRD